MKGSSAFHKVILLLVSIFIVSCGGGSSSTTQPIPAPVVYTGVFVDSPVAGLSYITTSGESGTTNSSGEFQYQDGDKITFSLANIVFPATLATSSITPFDLLDSKNIYNQQVINTIQLLQSLDENRDPLDGIALDENLMLVLASSNIEFSDLQLTSAEFEQVIIDANVFSDSNSENHLVSSELAIEHFATTLRESDIIDSDGDQIMNDSDSDDDNDGIEDEKDVFPWDENESSDFDLDRIGDNADSDDDNDGIADTDDPILRIIYNLDSLVTSITHLKFHSISNRIFITNKNNKTLNVLDADTGKIVQTITFEKMPWRMALSNTSLYVALLDREFEYYSQESGSGEIISLDLTTNKLKEKTRFAVSVDPFDIVATDNGKVVVSSGSNQWTSIVAYNAFDGLMLGSTGIRHRSYLTLHPSQKWVFAADTDLSPSDFEKFDIESPGITSLGDSPYHGDYSIAGRVWASDEYVYSRSGHIFLASDMTYADTLFENKAIDDIKFDYQQNTAFILSDGITYLANLISSEVFATISNPGEVQHLLAGSENNYTISNLNNTKVVIKTLHPCSSCGSNTAPVADFSYTPTNGSTIDTYEFDASSSSDAEDVNSLQYRWDINNDNEWDNDFSSNPLHSIKFLTAGTKFVTLQVKDSGGLLHTKTLDIQVEQGVDSGNEVGVSVPYELQFNITDTAVDSNRQKLYVSDKSNKRLYVVNLDNGQTEKYFEFDFMPERIAISPDGTRLYLALLAQNHSSYWWEEEQYGYIAVFDLASQAQINVFQIPTDPYDLVVNQHNKLIVSSGSGQWTDIYAFDALDGSILGKAGIRQASRLSLHPSGDYVFAADTDSSPSDFEKFDISGTGITAIGDSPYHGTYSIAGNIWATPDGQYVISRGGHVFLASDMTYVQSISDVDSFIKDITFDANNDILFFLSESSVTRVNLENFETIDDTDSQNATFVEFFDNKIFGLFSDGATSQLIQYTME